MPDLDISAIALMIGIWMNAVSFHFHSGLKDLPKSWQFLQLSVMVKHREQG